MSNDKTSFSDFKERVRAASDIVEVVGQYVKLRRTGSNWQGLCPFHNEKTPSFNVSPERQNYHCFGCHAGGDVFSFVMEQEGVTFKEALVAMAERAGIPVEKSFRRDEGQDRYDLFYRINSSSAEFFQKRLLADPVGKEALDYLLARGMKQETIDGFGLGFAPHSWRRLYEHLQEHRYPPEKVAEIGLIRKKSSGPGYYDAFRSRVIFPVRSVGGRVLGFGARVLDETLPKYINSADSPVYTKKAILYGLDLAWREIRREKLAVLVEGYFDVISLHQAGIPLAVAVCGTAFTSEQAKLLKRYTERVCVITDGDAAGQKAAVKACGVLIHAGLEATVVSLPGGEDPDSLVQREGADALREQMRNAPGYFEFLRETVRSRGDRPEERERAVRRALDDLAALADDDLRLQTQLDKLSAVFEVDKAILKRERKQAPRIRRRDREKKLDDDAGEEPRALREKLLLQALLAESEERETLLGLLQPEYFSDPLRARIWTILAELDRVPDSRELGELFPDPAGARAVHELTFLSDVDSDREDVHVQALRLKLAHLLERNREYQGRVQAMELAGEQIQPDLLDEWRHVGETIREVRAEIDQTQSKRKGR